MSPSLAGLCACLILTVSVDDLVLGRNGAQGWYLSRDLNTPGDANSTLNNIYYSNIFNDVATKKASGPFNVSFGASSVPRIFGLCLQLHRRLLGSCSELSLPDRVCLTACPLAARLTPGYSTTNDTFFTNTSSGNHAASLTYSSARNLCVYTVSTQHRHAHAWLHRSSWQNFSIPFPLIVGNVESVNPGPNPTFADQAVIPLQNVVYEVRTFVAADLRLHLTGHDTDVAG